MGPIRNPNWSTSGMRVTLSYLLMDLSKAFDCLPHTLLLLKLEAYGMSKSALQLIENYLTNRKQCVKVGTTLLLSNWQDSKGQF